MSTLMVDMKVASFVRCVPAILLSMGVLFVFSGRVSAQLACDVSCTTDSDCAGNAFCHSTINWGSWEKQITPPPPPEDGATTLVTGYDTHVKADGSVTEYMVVDGTVMRSENGGGNWTRDYLLTCEETGDEGNGPNQCGTPMTTHFGQSNLPNPIVDVNTTVITENGQQVLVTHLIRYRRIFTRKTNYETGALVSDWTRNQDLETIVGQYGDSWNEWVMLGFDSEIAYEDGRVQQRLIIGKVDHKGTAVISDDAITQSKIIIRVNKKASANSPYTWGTFRLAGETYDSMGSYGLGGSAAEGAQGTLLTYESHYNQSSSTYTEHLVRYYYDGSKYVTTLWRRNATKKAVAQKLCRPEVFPYSCTLPAYILPAPTLTPPPVHSPTPTSSAATLTKPGNYAIQPLCTAGKAKLSWTIPAAEDAVITGVQIQYCVKTGNQATCPTSSLKSYFESLSHSNGNWNLQVPFSDLGGNRGSSYLIKAQTFSNSLVPNQTVYSDQTPYVSVAYSGPEGDDNNDCTVNKPDYLSILDQYFNFDHDLKNNWAMFLINKLIRNFGTSN